VGLWSSDMETWPALGPARSTRASENGTNRTEVLMLLLLLPGSKPRPPGERRRQGGAWEAGVEVVREGGGGGVEMLKGEEGRCLWTA
jgi:hypothetical protein